MRQLKNGLAAFLILFSLNMQAADVSGNVFLDNDPNSENITITFSPVSPGAVYSQINANSDGSYSNTVVNGVYNVIFEQMGYQNYEFSEMFLNDIITFDDVTLSSASIVEVSGNVSGIWSNSSIYKVTGDITVPTGQTLTIEPGVEIKFDGYFTVFVDGTLIADGSEDENIRFTSNANTPTNSDWNSISFYGNTNSILNHCIIEYGTRETGPDEGIITAYDGNVSITNSIIRHSDDRGIRVYDPASTIIKNNKIYDCLGGITLGSDNQSINRIEGNEIYNIDNIGIAVSLNIPNAVVKHNILHDVGIYGIQNWSDIEIYRNIIYNVSQAAFSSGIFIAGGQPNITNNTIFNSRHGIGIYDSDFFNPNPNIHSNIIANNAGYAIHSEGVPNPALVAYNLFYNNTMGIGNNNLPAGVGIVATTNTNGVDSDVYYNIFSDPEFESLDPNDPLFCYPIPTSDAVDAADPSVQVVDGRADMGAIELGGLLGVGDQQLASFVVFPNPVGDFVNFNAPGNFSFNKIEIIDLQGRIVLKQNLELPVRTYQLFLNEKISSGTYLYNVSDNGTILAKGRLLKI